MTTDNRWPPADRWRCVRESDGSEIRLGDTVTDEREGKAWTVEHFQPPHREGTSGKITAKAVGNVLGMAGRTYYAGVFGARFELRDGDAPRTDAPAMQGERAKRAASVTGFGRTPRRMRTKPGSVSLTPEGAGRGLEIQRPHSGDSGPLDSCRVFMAPGQRLALAADLLGSLPVAQVQRVAPLLFPGPAADAPVRFVQFLQALDRALAAEVEEQ